MILLSLLLSAEASSTPFARGQHRTGLVGLSITVDRVPI